MPHFTLSNSPNGPIIDVFLSVSPPRAAELLKNNLPVPTPVQIRALLDTGASDTCIDPAHIARLGLTVPSDIVEVHTPSTQGTPKLLRAFDLTLVIPITNNTPHIVPVLRAFEADLLPQGLDALIGRDVLSACVLTYNGTMGIFTLAY